MRIKDKDFEIFIESNVIQEKVKLIAKAINEDYKDKNPLFIAVLNGAFMFASDLMKEINILSEISFIKLSSYQETSSTGKIKELLGLRENIINRHLVFIEDIVDTGNTIDYILRIFNALGPASIEFITLLHKPQSVKKDFHLRYVGFEIPPDFVVGYGLDYDGYGRNLKEVYQLKE